MKRFMWVAASAMALMLMLVTITACKHHRVTANRSAGANQAASVSPTNSDILTAAEVSQVTGLQGVVLVPYEPSKGAGGDLNFALPNGKMIMLVSLLSGGTYNGLKAQPGYSRDVTGIGDEAFIGKVANMETILYFRKGSRVAGLSSFINTDNGWPGTPYVSQEQLRQMAELMLPRM